MCVCICLSFCLSIYLSIYVSIYVFIYFGVNPLPPSQTDGVAPGEVGSKVNPIYPSSYIFRFE